MAVTTTVRMALARWSSGSDAPVTRAQLDTAHANIEARAAGFLQDVAGSRPAAAVAYTGFVFWATDTEVLSYCDGDEWATIAIGTFLALAGGTLAGALNMNGQELQGAVVLNAKDKRNVASAGAGGLTIDANDGPNQTRTLTGNISAITVNNLDDGESLRLTFIQDATGGRTVAWPGAWLWPGGAVATTAAFKTTANAVNVVVIDKVDTAIHAFLAADMKV